MYCVYKFIKLSKTIPQAFLFIGEPQNLNQLGYYSRFGLKDFIYVKIRAYPALAGLDPALACSKLQNTESVTRYRARAPSCWQRSSSSSVGFFCC